MRAGDDTGAGGVLALAVGIFVFVERIALERLRQIGRFYKDEGQQALKIFDVSHHQRVGLAALQALQ